MNPSIFLTKNLNIILVVNDWFGIETFLRIIIWYMHPSTNQKEKKAKKRKENRTWPKKHKEKKRSVVE